MIPVVTIVALALVGMYAFRVRPRLLRRGATDEEVGVMQTRQFAGIKRRAEREARKGVHDVQYV